MSEVSGLWSYSQYTPVYYFVVWADTKVVSECARDDINACFYNLDYSLNDISIEKETFNLPLEFMQ